MSKPLFEIMRFQVLTVAMGQGGVDDALAFAWSSRVYPSHHSSEIARTFADDFAVTSEMMNVLTEYLDTLWRQKKSPSFYDTEDHFKNKGTWERGLMIDAFRYLYLSRLFDETFWTAVMSSHPAEASSLADEFKADELSLF